MKRWLVGIITILFLISGILMSPVIGQAQEKVDYEALYNQGVSEGIIKQADVSLAAWTDENKNQYE